VRADLALGLRDLACAPAEILSLAAGGETLNGESRRALLERVRRNEVFELEVAAYTFHQWRTPVPLPASRRTRANATFVRFRAKELPAFARSFRGRPFLRNHDRGNVLARAGTILESELEEGQERYSVRQRLKVVKPWAVEAFLDGTMDAFSIGWDPQHRGFAGLRRSLLCTVCSREFFSAGCRHLPGDEVALESGERVRVELEWRQIVGAEVSAVTFPAVAGTHVDEVRSVLSEERARREKRMDEEAIRQELAELRRGQEARRTSRTRLVRSERHAETRDDCPAPSGPALTSSRRLTCQRLLVSG
jgi:hypothetical protein